MTELTLPPELIDQLEKLPPEARAQALYTITQQVDRRRRKAISKLINRRKEKVGGPVVGKATRQARNAVARAAGNEPEPIWSTSGVSRTGSSIGVKGAMRWHKRAS